jgi:hypothetical protein
MHKRMQISDSFANPGYIKSPTTKLGNSGHPVRLIEVKQETRIISRLPVISVTLDMSLNPIFIGENKVPFARFKSPNKTNEELGFINLNKATGTRNFHQFLINDIIRGRGNTSQEIYLKKFQIAIGINYNGNINDFSRDLNHAIIGNVFNSSWSRWTYQDGSWFIGPDGDDMSISQSINSRVA